MATIEHQILWRRIDQPGHDACSLWSTSQGWQLTGMAIFLEGDQPSQLAYEVSCDRSWQTLSARVTGWYGRQILELTITRGPSDRWDFNGTQQPQVTGCPDVDLGFTPATNLIALRRLALEIGRASQAPAAYLTFPELKMERLEQRYHRLNRDTYAYESPSAAFTGNLIVSEAGFVIHYPGLWEVETVQ